MTDDELKSQVLEALSRIAPEAEMEDLDPDVSFRDQLDIDSMDFLNFVIGLNERLGVEIPERDYPGFSTLNGAVASLKKALRPT